MTARLSVGRLPEVIGLARPHTPERLLIARAFQDEKFQRSHERTWLVADFSATRLITTPEIEQALGWFEAAREAQGAGNYTQWLIIGEGASAEAIEVIRREKLFCSCREQLEFISKLLFDSLSAGNLSEINDAEPIPDEHGPHLVVPALSQPAVIDLHAPAAPAHELSRLSLPAREGSEYMAAMYAEKLALRSEFSIAEAGKIKTAVLEGVLNAIEHSPNPEKLVDLEFRRQPEGLEIIIENEGNGFDPLEIPVRPSPRSKLGARGKRGWGINLMRQFMDEVDYEPCARGTKLRLLKRRVPAPSIVPRKAMGES